MSYAIGIQRLYVGCSIVDSDEKLVELLCLACGTTLRSAPAKGYLLHILSAGEFG